jgi:hypothetical protein
MIFFRLKVHNSSTRGSSKIKIHHDMKWCLFISRSLTWQSLCAIFVHHIIQKNCFLIKKARPLKTAQSRFRQKLSNDTYTAHARERISAVVSFGASSPSFYSRRRCDSSGAGRSSLPALSFRPLAL